MYIFSEQLNTTNIFLKVIFNKIFWKNSKNKFDSIKYRDPFGIRIKKYIKTEIFQWINTVLFRKISKYIH